MTETTKLRRNLTLALVVLYGLGNILGAGVYVLIGKVAGETGYLAPIAFLLASIIAALSAFSFAELSNRYPVSAGSAIYIQEGFGNPNLSLVIGLLTILTGIVSASTISKGLVGYLDVFVQLPDSLVITLLIATLGIISIWGILESVTVAAFFTLLEVSGLVLIISVAMPSIDPSALFSVKLPEGGNQSIALGLVGGAFIAFYAYIGFEDMVNVVEEVKKPEKNLPIAIVLALTLAALLYIAVSISSLAILTPAELSSSEAPLASVYEEATSANPWFISIVSMFAVANGALIQIIMASRVCYGLAQKKWLPAILGNVNTSTQTPINSTGLIVISIIIAALWLPIETLAKTTSYLLLIIFSLVNIALVKIKLREGDVNCSFTIPIALPISGAFLSIAFLVLQTVA